jgi:hypothetical protein
VRKRSGSKAQQKRIATAAAAKQRRQKVFAFGGLGVLAVLMFIQGPKLLDAFGGSDPAPTALSETPIVPVPESNGNPRALRLLKATGADPFASRLLADNDPQAGSVSGPGGTHDPFAKEAVPSPATPAAPHAEDPVAAPLTGKIVVGTPKPGAVAKRGWIVVLASIQTRFGRPYANRFATRVERNGLGSVAVLDSSTRKPLRSGYYVVYTGPFASLDAVQRSAAHVHAFGYRTAYVREILRY